jgi:N-acetylglucosaminyldiphosphoundecaprenol N-acetyl-beta-D-mannosaminyltransferase
MMAQIPGLRMAGCADGYFKEDGPVVEQIRASGADILFVCLGAPKQELWMAKNGKATGAKLMCGLGGSLDIFAGVSQRAPEIWVKLGLEWAYRLVKEPYRIGRMMNLPKFLFTAIGMRITGKR